MSVSESIELRFLPLEPGHVDRIMPIEEEAYPEAWSRGMFLDEVGNDHSHFYVVFENDELVGYTGFWLVADEAHITSVTVRSDCRRRGIGRLLVRFLIDAARQAGARVATLEVRVSNVGARRLYEAFGFQPVGIRRGYYARSREDALVMMKKLVDA